ncbi:MAG TPA: hypothetical protein VII56_06255 [Rhizomicrobium sp.]
MRAVSLFFIGLLAAQSSAAIAAPDCPSYAWGAKVVRTQPIEKTTAPAVMTMSRAAMPGEGEYLCGGRMFVNPRASGMILTIAIRGGARPIVRPGEQLFIPMPGMVTMVGSAQELFERMFGVGGTVVRSEKSQTLGPSDAVVATVTTINAIHSWGLFNVFWPRPADYHGAWTVYITSKSGTVKVSTISRNFVSIDLEQQCPKQCTLAVTGSPASTSLFFHIRTAQETEAPFPTWLDRLDDRDDQRALLGGWLLLQPDPSWRDQGRSLLWQSTCNYPAVGRAFSNVDALSGNDACGLKATIFLSLQPGQRAPVDDD